MRRNRPCRARPPSGPHFDPSVGTAAGDMTAIETGFWVIDSSNPNSWTSAESMARMGRMGCRRRPAANLQSDKTSGGIATFTRAGMTAETAEHLAIEGAEYRVSFTHVSGVTEVGLLVVGIYLRDTEGRQPRTCVYLRSWRCA